MKPSDSRLTSRRRGTLGRLAEGSSLPHWRKLVRHRILQQLVAALVLIAVVGLLRWIPAPPVEAAETVVVRALTEDTEWAATWRRARAAVASLPVFRDAATSLPAMGLEDETRDRLLVPPLEGELISPFGWRSDPETGEMRFHPGVDLAAPVGTPVRAAANGRIDRIWLDEEYGLAVEIEHPAGFFSLYAHMDEVSVGEGREVRAGEVIGASGESGRVSGPHLHFEIRVDGRPVDPLPLLGEGDE